jgi:hypothetical protein
MGTYRDSSFALLPELDLKARWMLTDRLSLHRGYHLLFLTNVHRTGQQIDRPIDASQLSGALPVNNLTGAGQIHPVASPSRSTLRTQAMTFGLTFMRPLSQRGRASLGRNQRRRKKPKREIRNPKQIQNPKPECPKHAQPTMPRCRHARMNAGAADWYCFEPFVLEFWICFGFRASDFKQARTVRACDDQRL